MPITADEWAVGRELDDLDRNVLSVVESAWPRALAGSEVVDLITTASGDSVEGIDFRLMSNADPAEIRSRLDDLATAGVFARKEITTEGGTAPYYRWQAEGDTEDA